MPKPIVGLSEQLRQFVEYFRRCFNPHQWRYFVIVLLGLIECEERTLLGVVMNQRPIRAAFRLHSGPV